MALLLLGWLVLFSVARPDAGREVSAQGRQDAITTSADARARWDALSSEDKNRLQKRFQRLQELDEHQRADLSRRAERWRAEEERVLGRLSKRDRNRLMQYQPRKRRRLTEEMVRAERRDAGLRLESKLPAKTREWLATAPPEQRRKRLDQFKKDTREQISAVAAQELIEALGLGAKELKRLERLPLEERMSHVLRLRKDLATQQLAASGLPAGFTRERWDALEALAPDEYFIEILRLRREGLLGELPPMGREKQRKTDGSRGGGLTRALRRALHISSAEFLELADLSEAEREDKLALRRRDRVIAALRDHGSLPEDQIEALAEYPDSELFRRVRAVTRQEQSEQRE
jgi:hypothetical protein